MVEKRRRVFFPWERRRGVRSLFEKTRIRAALLVIALLAIVVLVRRHEENKAAVRATRAAIGDTSRAMYAFRADHGGACPREVNELVRGGYMHDAPMDAWGRPIRMRCPGRRDEKGFEVWSDGPDGVPGGLDRVE